MEKLKKNVQKFLLSYRHLPEKKQYVEFFTALLTVPVLITVLALNLNNLKTTNKKSTTQNTTTNTSSNNTPEKIYITAPAQTQASTTSPTEGPCTPGIGDISIDNPQEGDTVSNNPIAIDVTYKPNGYCQVVWSYRINGAGWSDYDDKSIALYNLPQGAIKLDLRVKSIVSDDQKTLTRNFTYKGNTVATITPTDNGAKTSSTSAN